MSISTTANRANFTGTSLVNVYAYAFKILDDDDLRVTVRDLAGAETTLTKTTHYTVSGVDAVGGGNVTLVAGFAWMTAGFLATGYKLTIRRVVSLLQETDIRNQGEYFPELHEDVFDRNIMVSQQQQDELNRSIKASETETVTLAALPDAATRASQFVGFDVAGQLIVGQPTGVPATAYAQTLLDDTTAAEARTTLGFGAGGAFIVQTDLAAALQALLFSPGFIQDDAGSVAPSGWVACDGTAYDKTVGTYAALFARIGNAWDAFNGQAVPGGNLFRVPKLNGMTTVGAGAAQVGTVATSLRALGAVVGAESSVLIEANLPAHQHAVSITSAGASNGHTHSGTTSTDGAHANLLRTDTSAGASLGVQRNASCGTTEENVNATNNGIHNHAFSTGGQDLDHTHSVSGNTGSGAGVATAFTNIQPSAVVNKIIKL